VCVCVCVCVCVYIYIYICICMKDSRSDPNSYTLESDCPELDRPSTCVIAQQYSSATLVSSRFHSCKENFGACLKRLFHFFTFQVHSHSREKRLLAAPCLSVCLSACIGAAAIERIFMKIDIGDFYEKCVKKLQISLKSDRNVGHFA